MNQDQRYDMIAHCIFEKCKKSNEKFEYCKEHHNEVLEKIKADNEKHFYCDTRLDNNDSRPRNQYYNIKKHCLYEVLKVDI